MKVSGAAGWKVNSQGRFFLHDREKPTAGKNAPTIDLGVHYAGPLPPAYGHVESVRDARGQVRQKEHRERFADEIMAWEFLGRPPNSINGMHVLHKDGDGSNCAADNLEWIIDQEFFELREFMRLRRDMETSLVPVRRASSKLFKYSRFAEPLWVGADNLPGWTPTNHEGSINGQNAA